MRGDQNVEGKEEGQEEGKEGKKKKEPYGDRDGVVLLKCLHGGKDLALGRVP